jgi:hypothetical protein
LRRGEKIDVDDSDIPVDDSTHFEDIKGLLPEDLVTLNGRIIWR